MTAPQPLQPRDPDVLGNETALWRAVVSQAIVDATAATSLSSQTDTRRARLWFEGNSKDFRDVCALADLEPDTVRRFALEKIRQSIESPSLNPYDSRSLKARRYKAFGESLSIKEWSNRLGISKQTLAYRLNSGMSPEDALTAPPRRQRNLEATQ